MKTATSRLIRTSPAHFARPLRSISDALPAEPQIIVASVLADGDRFLVVEERVAGVLRINQPAGRLEPGEMPSVGAVRETWEESGVRFEPTHLVGIYSWHSLAEQKHFLRLAYTGRIADMGQGKPNDPNIERVLWLTHVEMAAQPERHRSPFVLACVTDYLRGIRYPLDAVRHFSAS